MDLVFFLGMQLNSIATRFCSMVRSLAIIGKPGFNVISVPSFLPFRFPQQHRLLLSHSCPSFTLLEAPIQSSLFILIAQSLIYRCIRLKVF